MRHRDGLTLTLGVLLLPAFGWLACDTAPPTYAVQSTILRLIPDVPVISSNGGAVVVVLELSRAVDASAADFTTIVQAFGGSLSPLPGATLCATAEGGPTFDASAGVATATAAIPFADFRKSDNQTDTHLSAITVSVPPGADDVLLVGAAYASPTTSIVACSADPGDLLAFGTVRIVREEAGVPAPDASTDSTAADGAAADGDMVDGESETSTDDAGSDGTPLDEAGDGGVEGSDADADSQ